MGGVRQRGGDKPDNEPGEHGSPAKRPRTGGLVGAVVSPIFNTVANQFTGLFPFINSRLKRQQDFDLKYESDRIEVDQYLSDLTALKHQEAGNEKLLEFAESQNNKPVSYVKVASTNSEKSFNRHRTWLKSLLKVVAGTGGDEAGATRQITKALVRHDREAVVAGLSEVGTCVVKPMDATSEAAMFADGNIASRKSRRRIRRHLRHQFGAGALAPERTVMALHEGHAPVKVRTAKYEKDVGETPEEIQHAIKNAAREIERLVTSVVEVEKILPEEALRIDVTSGGDHGQGALQLGIRLTIVVIDEKKLEDPDDDDDKSITLNSIVGEATCKKDNAAVLKLTLNDDFAEAMKAMVTGKLEMAIDEEGKVQVNFVPLPQQTAAKTLRVNLCVVSDLAFHGMVMGRESIQLLTRSI